MRWLATALAFVSSLLIVSVARADRRAEARAEFKLANELMDEGHAAEALDRYLSAYAKWPRAKILLNMGSALLRLGRTAEAVDVWERYVNDPDADPGRLKKIQAQVVEFDHQVGKLRIEVRDGPARVRVDGVVVGEDAGPFLVRVKPGEHVVLAEPGDGATWVATVTVGEGEVRDVLLAAPSALPEPVPAPVEMPVKVREPPAPQPATSGEAQSAAPAPAAAVVGRRATQAIGVAGLVRADVNLKQVGATVAAGGALRLGNRIELGLVGLLGVARGVEAGVKAKLLGGRLAPTLAVATPVLFVKDGPLTGLRAAVGLAYAPARWFRGFIEVGGAYFLLAGDYRATTWLSSVGLEVGL